MSKTSACNGFKEFIIFSCAFFSSLFSFLYPLYLPLYIVCLPVYPFFPPSTLLCLSPSLTSPSSFFFYSSCFSHSLHTPHAHSLHNSIMDSDFQNVNSFMTCGPDMQTLAIPVFPIPSLCCATALSFVWF